MGSVLSVTWVSFVWCLLLASYYSLEERLVAYGKFHVTFQKSCFRFCCHNYTFIQLTNVCGYWRDEFASCAFCTKFIKWTHNGKVAYIGLRNYWTCFSETGIRCLYWKVLEEFTFESHLSSITNIIYKAQIEPYWLSENRPTIRILELIKKQSPYLRFLSDMLFYIIDTVL